MNFLFQWRSTGACDPRNTASSTARSPPPALSVAGGRRGAFSASFDLCDEHHSINQPTSQGLLHQSQTRSVSKSPSPNPPPSRRSPPFESGARYTKSPQRRARTPVGSRTDSTTSESGTTATTKALATTPTQSNANNSNLTVENGVHESVSLNNLTKNNGTGPKKGQTKSSAEVVAY